MMNSEQPKNIMIIESGEGVGGSAFSMYRIIKYLDSSKFRPQVVVYYRTPVFSKIEALGVNVTVLPTHSPFPHKSLDDDTFFTRCRNYLSVYGNLFFETLGNGIRLARIIRKVGIDIVHCNNGFFENFAAVFAARLTGTPCIAHIRGTEPLMKIERLLHRWMSKIIVLNQEMFDVYADAFGADKVSLIDNGVDLDEFDNSDPQKIRDEFSIDGKTFCVGTFARLVEGKGVPEFLQAAARACEKHNNMMFFVVGGGTTPNSEFELSLHALVKHLGIGDRVIFAGWRDDVQDCMSAMDLIVQISTTFPEGMSLAPIEAMALSKPVIVTDIAGYANIVIHGKSGLIVPVGDVDILTELIGRLANDRDLARRLGESGRERVLEKFDSRIVARRVEEIYAQTLCG
jgi:glycosyltransferase involved in cell wall biosynthesis